MIAHRARKALHRFGIDVARYPRPHEHRRARLLEAHGVDLVVDVGGATGLYGLSLRRCGYRGSLASCEPLQGSYGKLHRVASGDPSWATYPVALGDTDGDALLNVAGNADSSSLLPMLERHAVAAPGSAYTDAVPVEMTTVTSLLSRYRAQQRVFLKIDVQGFERQVLAGAEPSMHRIVGVQLEMSLVPLYENQMLFDEALSSMRSRGFALMGVESGFSDSISGELYQLDGIFFRDRSAPTPASETKQWGSPWGPAS